jgi:hypothetical protein
LGLCQPLKPTHRWAHRRRKSLFGNWSEASQPFGPGDANFGFAALVTVKTTNRLRKNRVGNQCELLAQLRHSSGSNEWQVSTHWRHSSLDTTERPESTLSGLKLAFASQSVKLDQRTLASGPENRPRQRVR